MSADFLDSQAHYQHERELGHNRAGGRVTYLAIDLRTQQRVVIKQFQFAKSGSSWTDYDAYDREIQLLKQLNHSGIPKYLDTFQTPDGFCMVQEYKPAASLATGRSLTPEEISLIAIAVLEILVYLQNRIPIIIHRDIKPENILLDEQGQVYLVDFGFARVGGEEVGVSSVVKGTLGFMPPEQLFNRQLTEASDLYGLGMTLICLLTGTKSDRIGDVVDISYRVSFKHLVSKLNFQWVNWLEKMVEPRLKDRFPNAVTALSAIPILPLRPPEAQFSQSSLVFKGTRSSLLCTQSVVITNPIPSTLLEGNWEVAFHPHDPRTGHQWITVDPISFVSNRVECQTTVETRNLIAGKIYQRKLLLHTNTLAKTYPLNLQIQTPPVSRQTSLLPSALLLLLGLISWGISGLMARIVLIMGTVAEATAMAGFGSVVGAAIGLQLAAWGLNSAGMRTGATANTLAAIAIGGVALAWVFTGDLAQAGSAVILGAGAGGIGSALTGTVAGAIVENLLVTGTQKAEAIALSLLTSLFGIGLGLGLAIGITLPVVLLLCLSSSLLIILAIRSALQRMQLLLASREANRYRIKP